MQPSRKNINIAVASRNSKGLALLSNSLSLLRNNNISSSSASSSASASASASVSDKISQHTRVSFSNEDNDDIKNVASTTPLEPGLSCKASASNGGVSLLDF